MAVVVEVPKTGAIVVAAEDCTVPNPKRPGVVVEVVVAAVVDVEEAAGLVPNKLLGEAKLEATAGCSEEGLLPKLNPSLLADGVLKDEEPN